MRVKNLPKQRQSTGLSEDDESDRDFAPDPSSADPGSRSISPAENTGKRGRQKQRTAYREPDEDDIDELLPSGKCMHVDYMSIFQESLPSPLQLPAAAAAA